MVYEYDAAGRLAAKTTPNGAAVRFLYDMAGKPLAVYTGEAVSTPEDVPGERLVVRYEYNGAGQVVREENRDSLLTYAYDEFGRLSRVDYPNLGRWVTYDYGLDRPTRVRVFDRSYSTSTSVYDYTLAYNESGEVASARQSGTYYGHYAYDENGRRLQRTLGNGTVNSYEYDDNDRLKQLSITHDGEVLASFRYSHDGAGNRTGIEYGDGSRSVYEYDEAYRLIRDLRVDARGGTLYDESYAYDAVGNRLRKTRLGGRNPVDVAYAYNARNQIVSATGDEAGEYEYDRDGNLIRTAGPHGVETREYDVLGRLTGYAGPGGTERYTHIGADWKRQTAVYTPTDGEEEKYTFLYDYDGDNVLMDLMGDSLTLRNTYVTPFLDENLVMIRAGEGADHYYMSHDGLGSVRVVNNASGHLRNVYDYTAYGEPDPVSTFNGPVATHQRYGFTGRENNPVAGDIFYRYRNYSAFNGVFSRRDPSSYSSNRYGNLYGYVSSSPVAFRDPLGLSKDLSTLEGLCDECIDLTFDPETRLKWLKAKEDFIKGGYKNDSKFMSGINSIKSFRGNNNWREDGIAKLNQMQNSLCPNNRIDLAHHFRNLFNKCPQRAPSDSDSNWQKEFFNPFHITNTCFRGLNENSGSQCCYGRNSGILDDDTIFMGTYDYSPPSVDTARHYELDVAPHIWGSMIYARGLTCKY